EVQWLMSSTDVDPGSHGVTQDLAEYPAAQVPQVLGPRPLDVETPGQLAVDRLDQPVQPAPHARPLRLRVAGLVRVRRQQADATAGQFLRQRRRPIVAVAEADAAAGQPQLPEHFGLRRVGRAEYGGLDDAVAAGAQVPAEAVERLADHVVLAAGSRPGETPAVSGAGKLAGRHRHAIDVPQGVINSQPAGQVLLETW